MANSGSAPTSRKSGMPADPPLVLVISASTSTSSPGSGSGGSLDRLISSSASCRPAHVRRSPHAARADATTNNRATDRPRPSARAWPRADERPAPVTPMREMRARHLLLQEPAEGPSVDAGQDNPDRALGVEADQLALLPL